MPTLTNYLDREILQQLQDIFAQVTRAQMRIYGSDGDPLTELSDTVAIGGALAAAEARKAGASEVPIVVEGRTLGRIVLEQPSQARWPAEQMMALADALEVPVGKLRQAIRSVPAVDSEANRSAIQMLGLMSRVIGRLCKQQSNLRSRIEELSTLYKVTALFSGHRDLAKVLDIVVNTVVTVTGVKSCGLRLLNEQTNELRIAAVANLSGEYLDKGTILLSASVLDIEAFESEDVVYIADERTDPRVLYPQECRREGIVSALIAPLLHKGRRIGALRLYTDEPHQFSRYEVSMVKAIAAQAAGAIVGARLHEQALAAEAVQRQLRLAAVVQRRMIPDAPPEIPGLDLAGVYVPSLELSGDFYDFIALPEDNLGVAICDVMGKGLPASLLMASVRASLRAHASVLYELSEVLGRVNRGLCADTLTTAFATAFYGVLDMRSRTLTYVNAGHEPPLLIRQGQARSLTVGGMPLGIEADTEYELQAVKLAPGDTLVLATDGVSEAMNFDDEPFGRERFTAAAIDAVKHGMDANGISKHVLWKMRSFVGLQIRKDDVTMVTARLL